MKLFNTVKVIAVRGNRFADSQGFDKRAPRIGDIGTILGVYAGAYEVECADSDGSTIWLIAMYPDELAATEA